VLQRPEDAVANMTCCRLCTVTFPTLRSPIRRATRIDASFCASATATMRGTLRCARPAARHADAASVAYPCPPVRAGECVAKLDVAGRLEDPEANVTDHRAGRALDQRPVAEAASDLGLRVLLQFGSDGVQARKCAPWNEAHHLRVAVHPDHRGSIEVWNERTDAKPLRLNRQRNRRQTRQVTHRRLRMVSGIPDPWHIRGQGFSVQRTAC